MSGLKLANVQGPGVRTNNENMKKAEYLTTDPAETNIFSKEIQSERAVNVGLPLYSEVLSLTLGGASVQ